MTDNRKMLLSTLTGLFFPLLNIVAPLLIPAKRPSNEAFRSKLLIIEGVITGGSLTLSVALIIASLSLSSQGVTAVNATMLTAGVVASGLQPLAIVVTVVALWRKTAK